MQFTSIIYLLDIQEYYEVILKDAHESPEQVEREAQTLAAKWNINSSFVNSQKN